MHVAGWQFKTDVAADCITILLQLNLKWYEFFDSYGKAIHMKGSRSQDNRQNKSMPGHRPLPQNKDDLDSRGGEEQDNKGDDVTNNRKEVHSEKPGQRGRDKE